MLVYDKAYELKKCLVESQEVIEYKEAYKRIMSNTANKNMLEDFRNRQMEIQAMQYSGAEPDGEKLDELERIYAVISKNPDISKFLQNEYRYSLLMNDISKIISEAVDIEKE